MQSVIAYEWEINPVKIGAKNGQFVVEACGIVFKVGERNQYASQEEGVAACTEFAQKLDDFIRTVLGNSLLVKNYTTGQVLFDAKDVEFKAGFSEVQDITNE